MKLESIHIQNFKRFADLTIDGLQPAAKLIVLTGPNGCGKTSLFEAFHFWMSHAKQYINYESEYYEHRLPAQTGNNWAAVLKNIQLKFHDVSVSLPHGRSRKDFYIRSAYRHEAEFSISGLGNVDDILYDSRRPQRLIQQEQRVSENYQRIVAETVNLVFSNDDHVQQKKVCELADDLVGEVRNAMMEVFGDLILEGVGKPLANGTFRFKKGEACGFHYKNLSGGEKAAFDLLLDFIIKRKAFDDTIYCIDEPELHMHSRLQAKLLEVMFNLIPDNCQLWIATHSIGMARKAAELYKENPEQVAFIDFSDRDFDQAVTLTPIQPNRLFWDKMFETALDDLGALVAPEYVVFCEGRPRSQRGKNQTFDATVYKKIFESKYPLVEFIPLGGTNEVESNGKYFSAVMKVLAPGSMCWMVFDRDDRHDNEVQKLQKEGIQVLGCRDLESYLWSEEILEALCKSCGQHDKWTTLKTKIEDARQGAINNGKPPDDIKAISGTLYVECKKLLGLTRCGNDSESFALYDLVPLVTPDTKTYQELEAIVMAPIIGKAHDSH